MKYVLILAMAFLMLSAAQVFAGVVFSDGFESYQFTDAGWNLDMNGGGPNANTNGNLAGNPWWGPQPSNADIVDEYWSGITPHSGNQMMAGWYGGGYIYYNMAYRTNNNQKLSGNFATDWWFYDSVGSAQNFNAASHGYWADSVSITNYTANPIALDYPELISGSNLLDGDFAQRLSLGASNETTGGYDGTKYQARVKGLSGVAGSYGSNGWVNLDITRSVGWHHGRIALGAGDGNGNNSVSFFIDNMDSALLTTSAYTPSGYNLLEFQCDLKVGKNWGMWPVYDDVSISSIPEPGSFLALGAGLISLLGLRRRRS